MFCKKRNVNVVCSGHALSFEIALIILLVTRFFQPSHNTKRETRDFSAVKSTKILLAEDQVGKLLSTQFMFLCKLGIFCRTKPDIMKSTFLFFKTKIESPFKHCNIHFNNGILSPSILKQRMKSNFC